MTRPAVTFGLVAYNQENYVREAIAGAFAQTGPAMEIILSDDCSPDGTFAIMEEMAAACRGPHKVRVRREPRNVGLVQHMINLARVAEGDLLVIAAGDDVSYPDRAATLHEFWSKTDAAALVSGWDEIDADGAITRRNVTYPPNEIVQMIYGAEAQAHRVDGKIETIIGCCAAYRRSFWADLPDPPVALMVEDGIANALIILRGEVIARVPKALMAYRVLTDSLTIRRAGLSVADILATERKIDRVHSLSVAEIDYTLDQATREGITPHPKTLAWSQKGRVYGEIVTGYWQASLPRRLARLMRARTSHDLRFLMPRLLGFRAYAAMRQSIEWWRQRR
ncbi:MAG: glycosyltransferase [Pseudomonadota bacterium]